MTRIDCHTFMPRRAFYHGAFHGIAIGAALMAMAISAQAEETTLLLHDGRTLIGRFAEVGGVAEPGSRLVKCATSRPSSLSTTACGERSSTIPRFAN
jgi:hypothetical protein